MQKVSRVGVFLAVVMSLLVMPAFAGVLEPAKTGLAKLGEYLPKLGGLLLILVIGALIAVGIVALVAKLLVIIKLEKGAKKAKIPQILKKGNIGLSLSELLTEIIFFLIIIGTLIVALEFYGLTTSGITAQILSYIPNVIAAVFILILGIFLAILISGIIALVGGNVRIAQAQILANIAKYAIIVVAGLIALNSLGLGVILTNNSKDIILGGLILALALSFGLGAKSKAEGFLGKVFKK
ncbi:MAG: hypothetical protein ABIE75_03545 [Candidatus Omnitrophota bacterium]